MGKKLLCFSLIFSIIFYAFPKDIIAVTCNPPSLTPPNNTCSNSEQVNVTATVPDSTATFSGFAPAGSTVTIKDLGTVVGTAATNPSGQFNKTVITTPGSHTFSLYLTDTSAKTTPETSFGPVNIPSHGDTQIPSSPSPPNINLPPTISLSKTNITKGESTLVYGQTAPGSTLHLVLNGNEIYTTTVGGGGSWQYTLSSGYQTGANSIYAYLTRSGLSNSVNSFTLNLQVGNCKRSDLNCDGFVNLTDFSILLYWWDSDNELADTNDDGIVGLIDFSIMMFDWTD